MVTKHIGFRIPVDDLNLIQKVCSDRGENVANFARRAMKRELARMGYMNKEQAKALEVPNDRE